MKDQRSPIYFYKFDVDKKTKDITAKGIQFVTQTFQGSLDDTEFPTLLGADQDGHLQEVIDCWGGAKIVQEIAALSDKGHTAGELLNKIVEWRKTARTLYPPKEKS